MPHEETLFDATEGLRSEDLVTEIFAFILRAREFEPLQKIFYEHLFRDGIWRDTLDRRLEVKTQVARKDIGKPDLELCSDDAFVVIENKFDAEFSGGDQLFRYLSILRESHHPTKYLVLLCPQYAWERYEHQTIGQFVPHYGPLNSFRELDTALFQQHGIHFTAMPWDKLLDLLDAKWPLVSTFSRFVRNRFLVSVHFTEEERRLIMSSQIPEALNKLVATVQRVKGSLTAREFTADRIGQSINYYGFYITRAGYKFWFGYIMAAWEEYETPFFLQIDVAWEEKNDQLTDDVLLAAGFRKCRDLKYVLPLEFDLAGDEISGDLVAAVMTAVDAVVPALPVEN